MFYDCVKPGASPKTTFVIGMMQSRVSTNIMICCCSYRGIHQPCYCMVQQQVEADWRYCV